MVVVRKCAYAVNFPKKDGSKRAAGKLVLSAADCRRGTYRRKEDQTTRIKPKSSEPPVGIVPLREYHVCHPNHPSVIRFPSRHRRCNSPASDVRRPRHSGNLNTVTTVDVFASRLFHRCPAIVSRRVPFLTLSPLLLLSFTVRPSSLCPFCFFYQFVRLSSHDFL